MSEIPDFHSRRRWWQTPDGHIPYSGRMLGGLAFGGLFGAMFWHVLNSPYGWICAVIGPALVGIGIWDEWEQGY